MTITSTDQATTSLQQAAIDLGDERLSLLDPRAWHYSSRSGDLVHESGYGVRIYGAHGHWYAIHGESILRNASGRKVGYGSPSRAIDSLVSTGRIPDVFQQAHQ